MVKYSFVGMFPTRRRVKITASTITALGLLLITMVVTFVTCWVKMAKCVTHKRCSARNITMAVMVMVDSLSVLCPHAPFIVLKALVWRAVMVHKADAQAYLGFRYDEAKKWLYTAVSRSSEIVLWVNDEIN